MDRQMVRIGRSEVYITFTSGEFKSAINHWLAMDDAHKRLTAALHNEDITGRAIHEDRWSMQVPTFGPEDCDACQAHATRLLAAMAYDVKHVKVPAGRANRD